MKDYPNPYIYYCRHERNTYYKAGGKWKTTFKQLEYQIAKRGCQDCKKLISSKTVDKEA